MAVTEPSSRPPLVKPGDDLDVAVIGAGAAGIAAVRACRRRGLTAGIFEARGRVGGRAVTALFGGHPVDLGAHWMHAGDLNPLLRIGLDRGEPIRRGPGRGELVIAGRPGTARERRAHGLSFEIADRAFGVAAHRPADSSMGAAMPPLGPWRRAAESTFTLVSGRPLEEVSVKDFPSEEFGDNHFVRGGYGAYLARLAAGLPVALSCPVRQIDWSGPGVSLETDGGRVRARAAIVTVPVTALAAGGVRFTPPLPSPLAGALEGFLPGTYEHVVVAWPGAPFRLPDRLVKLLSGSAVLGLMTRMDGAPFHYVEFGFPEVAARRGRGPAGLARLAREGLIRHFGGRAIADLRVLAVTDWLGDPWSLGSWAVAPPGRHGARRTLSRPAGDRIWLAGEANMPAMWGTVGGAWDAGEAAAEAVADRHAETAGSTSGPRGRAAHVPIARHMP